MDYKLLSVQVALEAMRRGADQQTAILIAKEVIMRLEEVTSGSPDLILVLMNIENAMRSYGYPAR